jgi:hypothetical protein
MKARSCELRVEMHLQVAESRELLPSLFESQLSTSEIS